MPELVYAIPASTSATPGAKAQPQRSHAIKLMVANVAALRVYTFALGLKVVIRPVAHDDEARKVSKKQCRSLERNSAENYICMHA